MSTEDLTENLVGDALRARVDHTVHPRTPLADVVSTARGIRRRRRVRTAAVAAVVVAVLTTPFVVSSRGEPDSAPDPAPSAPTRLADIALGDAPAIAWLDGDDYVAADGTRTTLPLDDVTRATPYLGGFLVTAGSDRRVRLLDGRLREVWQRCTTGAGFAVSDDGLRTAYPTSRCDGTGPTLHVGPTGGGAERTATLPIADLAPVGLVGDRVVVSSFNEGPPAIVGPDGSVVRLDALGIAADAEERLDLVAGRLAGEPSPEGLPTGVVVDASTGAVRWSVTGYRLLAFSPDGSMVVGAKTGAVPTVLATFDSETGEQVHELELPADVQVWQLAWEDDEHLLIAVSQGRTETMLRTTLDGTLERATDTAPYDKDRVRRFGPAPNKFG